MHEMNAYRAGHVCLSVHQSVRMIQLENCWVIMATIVALDAVITSVAFVLVTMVTVVIMVIIC
jgi:hypothetical protein